LSGENSVSSEYIKLVDLGIWMFLAEVAPIVAGVGFGLWKYQPEFTWL